MRSATPSSRPRARRARPRRRAALRRSRTTRRRCARRWPRPDVPVVLELRRGAHDAGVLGAEAVGGLDHERPAERGRELFIGGRRRGVLAARVRDVVRQRALLQVPVAKAQRARVVGVAGSPNVERSSAAENTALRAGDDRRGRPRPRASTTRSTSCASSRPATWRPAVGELGVDALDDEEWLEPAANDRVVDALPVDGPRTASSGHLEREHAVLRRELLAGRREPACGEEAHVLVQAQRTAISTRGAPAAAAAASTPFSSGVAIPRRRHAGRTARKQNVCAPSSG